MKSWHGLFQILKFPIAVIFLGTMMLGIGNLLTNSALGIVYMIDNDMIRIFGETMLLAGRYIIVNFPLLLLLRVVFRKGAYSTTIISALAGYVIFLVATMLTTRTDLTSNAYSAILGLSISKSTISTLANGTHYPLQTGLIGAAAVAIITLTSYQSILHRNEYGFLSFISKEAAAVIRTIVFSMIAGILFGLGWPYVVGGIERLIDFISVDTTNPVNLALYGILDRILGVFNLGSLIRNPFWYNAQGGSWLSMTGISVIGDANIWSQQFSISALTGIAGRFFTPYYILNIFAMPAMMWAMCTLETNKLERRKMRMLCLVGTIVSMMSGNLLVMELIMLFLCPILFLIHVGYTGILFGLLQAMHVYLGFNTSDTTTLSALPGTLPELITYIGTGSLRRTLVILAIVGILSAIVYFLTTRIYFMHLAADLLKTGDLERTTAGTIKALGGIENIKVVESSVSQLKVSLYDNTYVEPNRLRKLGAFKVYEDRTGFTIAFGASSTMIRRAIERKSRDTIRSVNN